MDTCIRAMEENKMSSSSSSASSSAVEIDEIDRMDEDTPPPTMTLSEELLVLTSSERPNASTSSVDPTSKSDNGSSELQSESLCTLDIVMDD